MNVLSYECSSGCESGWTSYLEQSFCLGHLSHKSNGFNDKRNGFREEHRKGHKGEEEEEDLSMISDASSGPPHFSEDNGHLNDDNSRPYTVLKVATLNKNGGKSHRNKEHQQLPCLLDDTASSPLINFSKGGPAFQDQSFGVLQPSPSGNH
ncbi:hypothetical protein V6N13_029924 [Hibiscus sabdariffa]|uniref:Uncharacterized protein n=2 Tax=Hibiscus sabdariffa TaxID=183260 RepID=A0ABR1ZK42_9ROSI